MDVHRQEAKLRWFRVPPPTLKITEEIMGLASARNRPAQRCKFTGRVHSEGRLWASAQGNPVQS